MGNTSTGWTEYVALKRQAVDERRECIIKVMLNSNGEPILGKELGRMFGCGEETIRKDMVNYIIPQNLGIVKYAEGPGYVYTKPAEEKKPIDIFRKEPKMEKAPVVDKQTSPMKNHEGYIDPTAGRAIAAVDGPEEGPAFAMAGDVWECACSDGSTLRYLILASFEKFSIGLVLNSTQSKDVPKKFQRKITAGLDTRYTDIRRVSTKPNKYMTQKVGHLGGEVYDSILKDAVGVFASIDSNAVADPDMWNALNAREKDLNKREDHLDERAKEIAKQQMEADKRDHELMDKETALHDQATELNTKKLVLDNREEELDDLAKNLNNDRVKLAGHNETIKLRMEELDQREADLHTREMSLDSADSQTSDLELALLKQKVEIYEKLIFGERRIAI